MSLFEKRGAISRGELRSKLRRAPSSIPGTRRSLSKRERIDLEKDISKRYGRHISKKELKKHIGGLEKERFRTRGRTEKSRLDDKIKYLKEQGGF